MRSGKGRHRATGTVAQAGAEGLLCCTVPEAYGGMGLDYLFDVVVFEELWRSGASGPRIF